MATKTVITKEVKEAIENGNRRVLNKALYRLYLAKVNPDYKIGDKEQHEKWYAFISGVIDGSISLKDLEAQKDKKPTKSKSAKSKTTKASSTETAKSTKKSSKNSTASVRDKLITDYKDGKITAEQFATALCAL